MSANRPSARPPRTVRARAAIGILAVIAASAALLGAGAVLAAAAAVAASLLGG